MKKNKSILWFSFLKKIFKFVFEFFPYVFVCYIFSGVILLSVVAIFKPDNSWVTILNLCHLLFFMFSLILFRRVRSIFSLSKLSIKDFNFVLLIFGLGLISYRFAIYFHALDDYVLHMISGYYALSIWNSNNFMPMSDPSYLYPLLQVGYYPLIEIIGIRLSLLLLSLIQLFWFLSLNWRIGNIFKFKNKSGYFYLNLFFIFLYFLPELVLTHVLFMSDFYTVLFSLEVLYLFLTNGNTTWMIVLMVLTVLTKQSSGLFVLPLFIYFLLLRIKNITKKEWLVIFVFISLLLIYCLRDYIDTGNPISYLYNSIFKSPLYIINNARDFRWGPVGIKQILIWPLIAFFNKKYIEWIVIPYPEKTIFSLFLIVPYVLTFLGILIRKKIIYLVMFLSVVFWSWQSGYGRYQTSMNALIWIILLFNIIQYLPVIKNKIFIYSIYFVFSLFCFVSIKNDFALRGFILDEYFPLKISAYYKSKYIEGLKLLGKDRYIDIYNSVKNKFDGFKAIVVVNRGGSSFYSFLAAKYKNMPIYTTIPSEEEKRILSSNIVSNNIKVNLSKMKKNTPILLMADLDYENDLKKSSIYLNMNCKKIFRDKIAPQFEHEHYFNYVEEYSCI